MFPKFWYSRYFSNRLGRLKKKEKKFALWANSVCLASFSSFSDAFESDFNRSTRYSKETFFYNTKEGRAYENVFSKIWWSWLYIEMHSPHPAITSFNSTPNISLWKFSIQCVWFAGKLHAVTFIACWKRTLKSSGLGWRTAAILALRHKNIIFTCVS